MLSKLKSMFHTLPDSFFISAPQAIFDVPCTLPPDHSDLPSFPPPFPISKSHVNKGGQQHYWENEDL